MKLLPIALLAVASIACRRENPPIAAHTPVLSGHPVQLDQEGKIVAWTSYGEIARLGFHALTTKFPNQPNGKPTYYAHSRFDPVTFEGDGWPHNPAGLNAMLTDSALRWFAYSGDRAPLELARGLLDHQLAHGTTKPTATWASVPYASADAGSLEWKGADDSFCEHCGTGDGPGVIEPDKVGELGLAYLQFYEHSGEQRYLAAAIACADALAKHVRDGDATKSPWPFRVHAETGVAREEYSAHVIAPIALFDEAARLGVGDVVRYRAARDRAWRWLLAFPMKNDAWSGYFEDIAIKRDPKENPNQYAPLQTAKYLLEHPELDPDVDAHVEHLLDYAARTFAVDTGNGEKGVQFGAEVLSEQGADMWKMGSHTARFGALQALWFERTGNAIAKERAVRSLGWATYLTDRDGIVAAAIQRSEGYWFSDGYGDYLRHFVTAMGAVPEWSGARPRLVRTSSVVRAIRYGEGHIAYDTFDAHATDVLQLPASPASVTVDGKPVEFTVTPSGSGAVVRIVRTEPGTVEISV